MTLTQMVEAHDGGVPSDAIMEALIDIIRSDSKPAGWTSDVLSALTGDLNAAWRLLAPGWVWGMLTFREWDHRDWYVIVTDGRNSLRSNHQSLPCAMALVALKTWEIE